MKKLLLSTVAISGLAMVAAPASAQVQLNVGGHFRGYVAVADQDTNTAAGTEHKDVDFLKDTELHFSGETTLENGMTVGVSVETDVDGNDGSAIDESYAYFSSSWGRVNFGEEDGAGYLLQVAAPSADSNVDGARTYINPVNYSLMNTNFAGLAAGALDYDMDQSGKDTKLTYLTPVINGFQAGISYAADAGAADDLEGVAEDDREDTLGASYEVAVRYEGMMNNVGFAIGAGFAEQELEKNALVDAGAQELTDDVQEWNVGLDVDFGAFGLGVAYYENNHGEKEADNAGTSIIDDEEVMVIGADYTTGAFKIGASYYDAENVDGNDGIDAKRYTGGVVYSYGPGMTLRGSLSQVELEETGQQDQDATSLLIGTQIKF